MKKQILTGEESFEKIINGNYFYIDKTLFIKELLENMGTVTLITRPRRFGKTLNLSTLEHFFDVNLDGRPLFDGLKIMEHKEIVEKYMNKYPVISLTLKDVEEDNWKNCMPPQKSESLKELAQKGLKQIEEKSYIHNLKSEGYARILKYGIAFHKKNCEVAMERESIEVAQQPQLRLR